MNQADWEKAAGDPCKQCGAVVLRLPGGVCADCETRRQRKLEERLERRAIQRGLRKGTLDLSILRRGRGKR